MKKLFAVLMLFTLAVFAGCLTSSSSKNDTNKGNGGIYKVYGYVYLTSVNGSGIQGVTLKLDQNGQTVSTVSTDGNGYYVFNNIANGTYTVTPSKSGYTFDPPSVGTFVLSDKDVVVATIVATATGGGNNGGGTGGSGSYFPYKTGAVWTFDSTTDSGGIQSTESYVETIIGTKLISGKTYWMIEDKYVSDQVAFADTSFVRIDGNIVYGFINPALFGKTAPKTAKIALILKTAADVEIPLLNFGLSAGKTWTCYDTGVLGGSRVLITGKYVGQENVQVPAGSFQNCAKFEITSTVTYSSSGFSQTSTNTSLQWYAPNVGPVKMSDVTVSVSGNDSYTFTTTEVLKSYSIP